MRISDWSSDVCSSDLPRGGWRGPWWRSPRWRIAASDRGRSGGAGPKRPGGERMNERVTPLLRVNDLRIGFELTEGRLVAVAGVSFQIRRGRTGALVGESGDRKSVVSQAILGLLPRPPPDRRAPRLFAHPDNRAP